MIKYKLESYIKYESTSHKKTQPVIWYIAIESAINSSEVDLWATTALLF